MTSHHPTTETIIDYIHGELSPAADAALFEHFNACTDCRSAYEAELLLTTTLRAGAKRETLEMPSTVKAEVWHRVRAQQPNRWDFLFKPFVAIPVGAAFALAAFLAIHAMPAAQHPVVASQYYFDVHSAATRQENPLADRSAPVLSVDEASNVIANPVP